MPTLESLLADAFAARAVHHFAPHRLVGRCLLRLPPLGSATAAQTFVLLRDDSRRRPGSSSRPDRGGVQLRVWRDDASAVHATPARPDDGPVSRAAARVAAAIAAGAAAPHPKPPPPQAAGGRAPAPPPAPSGSTAAEEEGLASGHWVPRLDTHIHVDVLSAIGLLPADSEVRNFWVKQTNASHAHELICRIAPFQSRVPTAQWTSDPFVEAQLMLPSEPGDDDAAASPPAAGAPNASSPLRAWGAKARTPVRPADCAPVWDSELRLPLPNSPACSAALTSGRVALRLRLFDLDLVAAKNDFLGEVTIRLPPARPACAAESRRFDPRTSHVEHLIADGVFAIAEGGSAARKKGIGRLLAAAGRTPVASPEASQAASPAASPPASPPRSPRASSPAQQPPPPLPAGSLGALRARVSWGAGVACATPQHAASAAAANENGGDDGDSPGVGARSSASRVDLAGLKPALRPVLGVLTLTPLSISGAPAELLHSGSRVFASATIEHQDGCTRASERAAAAQPSGRSCDASWAGRGGGGGGALVFSVTDVTSEAVVTVLCCGAGGSGGGGDGIGAQPPRNHCCALGEIVLPVSALLGVGGGGWGDGVGVWRPAEHAAEQPASSVAASVASAALASSPVAKQSVHAPTAGRVFRAALLPAPGAKQHRRATPADGHAPLGVFAFSARLALVRPPSFSLHPSRPLLLPLLCLAPRPLPRSRRPLAPRSPDAQQSSSEHARAAAAASSRLSAASVSSAAGLRIVGGRTTDALLAPLLAPLRTLLYLQSWACPPLTAAVVTWWVVGCVAFPRCVRHETPATAAEQALRVLTVLLCPPQFNAMADSAVDVPRSVLQRRRGGADQRHGRAAANLRLDPLQPRRRSAPRTRARRGVRPR